MMDEHRTHPARVGRPDEGKAIGSAEKGGGETPRLAEMRQREQAATKGPWEVIKHNHVDNDLWLSVNQHADAEGMKAWIAEIKYLTASDAEQWANARFIAHARQDVPYLLDLVASLQQRIQTLSAKFNDAVEDRDRFQLERDHAEQALATLRAEQSALMQLRDDAQIENAQLAAEVTRVRTEFVALHAAHQAAVEDWRENAKRSKANADNEKIPPLDRRQCFGVSQAYDQCADELDALAASATAGETPTR